MLVQHHTHKLRFLNTPSSDLTKLFLAGLSRSVSQTFLSVFSSVYIYQASQTAGYSMKASIMFGITFYIILFTIKGAAVLAAEDYSRVHGFKNSIETSLLPFTVSIISFLLTSYSFYFLIPAAVFWGIHAGFYWWGYNGYFVKSGEYEHFGKELGELGVLETIAAILTPIAGSVVIGLFGFKAVYILSLLFMILAIYLISKGKDKKQKHDTDFDEMVYLFKKHKSAALAYTGSALQGVVYSVIWPLFLFLFFDSVLEMGAIISAAVLVAAILGVFIGDIDDRIGEKKLISLGTPLFVISWILRAFSGSVAIFVIADSFSNIGGKMVDIPLRALSFKKAIEKYTARAILFREIAITFGAGIGLSLVLIMFYIVPSFTVIFLVTALISLLAVLPVITGEFDDKK